jgi:hypothetical protein
MSAIVHDEQMTETSFEHMHVTIHLVQQSTVEFEANDLWPLHGAYSRFGGDLDSFAGEIARRLSSDGYLGFHPDSGSITVIPLSAVKRLDFTVHP